MLRKVISANIQSVW